MSKKDKARAWASFSRWVRARDARGGLYAICFTCGKPYEAMKMQAGHWLPRHKTGTFLDAHNVHAQCVGCNMYGRGQIAEYANALIERYGPEELETLTRLSAVTVHVDDWGYWERIFDEALILRRWEINPWREFVEGI